MKTLLTLIRSDARGVCHFRKEYSQSFLQGLFDLLYLAHAQVGYGSPYAAGDAIGQVRAIEGASTGCNRSYKSTLQVIAPSGQAGVFLQAGNYQINNSAHYSNYDAPCLYLKGEAIGIVPGIGTGAVIPGQRRLDQKIFHGKRGATGLTSFDAWTSGDNGDLVLDAATDLFGLFMVPLRGFRLSGFRALLYRTGSPGTVTLHIRGIRDGNGEVEGSDIAASATDANTLPTASPYEWREFVISPGIDLHPGFLYALYLEAPGATTSNKVNWRRAAISSPYKPRMGYVYSTDGGAGWYTSPGYIPLFELRGTATAELEYGGCDLIDPRISGANGEFSIARLFRNHSGGPVTVSEIGVCAAGIARASVSGELAGNVYPFCIARDRVNPGITVADGENLLVTYTPQITV